jgi:hypothetical protein
MSSKIQDWQPVALGFTVRFKRFLAFITSSYENKKYDYPNANYYRSFPQ